MTPLFASSAAPRLDREGLAALIPHRGAMCLLSALDDWDDVRIVCAATGHRDPDHPLRTAAGLPAAAAIEYAAQAAALHGGLRARAAGGQAAPGYLASARGVVFHRLRLDDLPGALAVTAICQAGDAHQLLYAFTVAHAGEPVVQGRLAVVLDTPLP